MAYLNHNQVDAIAEAVEADRAVTVFGKTYVPEVRQGGCWLAYYHDRSGMAVFSEEVEALRYAVNNSMAVTFWRYGDDYGDATRLHVATAEPEIESGEGK